jgi:hypothetical protein
MRPLVLLLAVGCSDVERIPLDYPLLDGAESALIAMIAGGSITVHALDADVPEQIRLPAVEPPVRIEAVILRQPLEQLGLVPGVIVPVEGRTVNDLAPIRLMATVVDDEAEEWALVEAIDPLFSDFGLPLEANDCVELINESLVEIEGGRPTFAFPLDDDTLLVGLRRGGVVRATRQGSYPVSTPVGMPTDGAYRDPSGRFWLGGNGDLWSGQLIGDRMEVSLATRTPGIGELRWIVGHGSTLIALSYLGDIFSIVDNRVELLANIPPNPVAEDLSNWGGVVWLSDTSFMVVHGPTKNALLFQDGQMTVEPLPIEGDTGWGGTSLVRDEARNRMLAGSTGQVMARDDATGIWENLGPYDVFAPWIATVILPFEDGFIAADATGRVWQYTGGAYCPNAVIGQEDIYLMQLLGDTLVVGSRDGEGRTRLDWLSIVR